jgi:hypothetical protein
MKLPAFYVAAIPLSACIRMHRLRCLADPGQEVADLRLAHLPRLSARTDWKGFREIGYGEFVLGILVHTPILLRIEKPVPLCFILVKHGATNYVMGTWMYNSTLG